MSAPGDAQSRADLMRRGPLAGRYPAVAAMVTLSLIPYLALSAALDPLVPVISEQLHTSAQTLSLGSGLGNAAYAVGTVLAVQFAQHAAERTAAHGAAMATDAGFLAHAVAVEAAPTWKGIVAAAHGASLIVLGPHRRNGLLGHRHGSVAAAVVARTSTPVLIIPEDHAEILADAIPLNV
jgi:nucleotide-binding universal stress UspA family protein